MQVALLAAGVQLGKPYNKTKVQQAMSAHFGRRVALHCQHGDAFDLWLCFDKHLGLFDCPANVQRRCGSVTFPAAAQDAHGIPVRSLHAAAHHEAASSGALQTVRS